ncbi:hypothetical protein BJ165DRAFT_1509646 [Panaeolus papilionaceus]|nr:hypothetical protein BJ165DRAFT_1509646 [Panaeolus papilionaceus]
MSDPPKKIPPHPRNSQRATSPSPRTRLGSGRSRPPQTSILRELLPQLLSIIPALHQARLPPTFHILHL